MSQKFQDKLTSDPASEHLPSNCDVLDALDVAEIGHWSRNLADDRNSTNDIFWKLFDAKPRSTFDFRQIIAAYVHGDDQDLLSDALDAVINPEGQGGVSLSFRVVHHDHSVRWLSFKARTVFSDGSPRTAQKITAVFRDVTDQRETDVHNRLLIQELNHRVKSMLSVVQSVAYQTFRRDVGVTGLFADFQGRLRALGKAHDLLVERRFLGTFLEPLAERILGACGAPFNRVVMNGFPLHLGSKQAVSLSMVLHELSINSLKYGAFSVPTGQVELTWTHNEQSDMVRVRWVETNGPTVIEPEEKGFGSRMIERAVALEFGGALTMDYAPEGVRCTMTIPFKSFDQTPDE